MAYYNSSGEITIDEAAANEDIRNIRLAIDKLNASQNSLNQLRSSASTMQGMTGNAILEKAQIMSKKIESLKENLESSIKFIQNTINKYYEIDRQLVNHIYRGGGVGG